MIAGAMRRLTKWCASCGQVLTSTESKAFAGACMLGYGAWRLQPWLGWCVGGTLLLAAAIGELRGVGGGRRR